MSLKIWPISTHNGGAATRWATNKSTPLSTTSKARVTTWEHTSHGNPTAAAGGAKARSNFTWTEIQISRPSAALAQKIISEEHGTMSNLRVNTVPFQQHFLGCPRSLERTAS